MCASAPYHRLLLVAREPSRTAKPRDATTAESGERAAQEGAWIHAMRFAPAADIDAAVAARRTTPCYGAIAMDDFGAVCSFDGLPGSSNDTSELSTELPRSTSSSAPAADIDATAAPQRSPPHKQHAALRFVTAMAAVAPPPTMAPEPNDGSVSSAGLCGSRPSPAKRQPRDVPVVWITSAPSISPKLKPTSSASWPFGETDCFDGDLAGLASCFGEGEVGTYVPVFVMDPTEEQPQ